MSFNEDVFCRSYPIWMEFINHYCAYIELQRGDKKLIGNKVFWQYTANAHIEMATIAWWMIFGSNSSETHWKKLGMSEEDFRSCLLKTLGITFSTWFQYWKDMRSFRNNYVAHRPKEYSFPVPYFDIALRSMLCLDNWVKIQLEENTFYIDGNPIFYSYMNKSLSDFMNETTRRFRRTAQLMKRNNKTS